MQTLKFFNLILKAYKAIARITPMAVSHGDRDKVICFPAAYLLHCF